MASVRKRTHKLDCVRSYSKYFLLGKHNRWFLFIGCILAARYFLKRRKPAWYAVIILHVAIISLSIDFAILAGFYYATVWASIIVGFAALYFAFRNDVRKYLAVTKA